MKNNSIKKDPNKVTIRQFFGVQLKILSELYKNHKFETTCIILFSSLLLSVQFIDLKFLEYITNSVFQYASDSEQIGFNSILLTTMFFFAALLILKLINWVNDVFQEKYISKIVFMSEKKIINKLSSISYEYYESNEFHDKINLARQASGQYAKAVFGITQFFNIIVLFIVYSIMLSRISGIFIAIILLSIIISVIISARVTDHQLNYWRSHVSPESRKNSYFKQIFSSRINHQNIQTTRSFCFFIKKYDYYNDKERKNFVTLNFLSFVTEFASSLLFIATFFIASIYVAKKVVSGELSIGYFSMTIALLMNLFSTIKQFTIFMLNGNWYVKILDSYYELLEFTEHTKNKLLNTENDQTIFMRDIKYKYIQSDLWAIKGITTSFNKGEKIAIVGLNGSGKTTMISIILSLLKKYEGEYGELDASKTAIMQNFGQYQLTIKENIELGNSGKSLSQAEIYDILKKVDLYDFIIGLPDGIYTKLGQLDDGVELSKGQWQKLSIARLLANNEANIWILDEPTAYLDPLSEITFYEFVFNISGDRLVFFISHRLGFARKADRIIVIDDGYIKETGTHSELMLLKNGIYRNMFESQKEWFR